MPLRCLGLRNFLTKILHGQISGFNSLSLSLAFTVTLKGTYQSTLPTIFFTFYNLYTFAHYVINNDVLRCVWIRTSNKNVKVSFDTWKFTTCCVDVSIYLRGPPSATWVVPHDVSTVIVLFRCITWSAVPKVVSKVAQCIHVLPQCTAMCGIRRAVMLWIKSLLRSCKETAR